MSAMNLQRLSHYLGRTEWWERAGQTMGAFSHTLTQVPVALPQMLCALLAWHSPWKQVRRFLRVHTMVYHGFVWCIRFLWCIRMYCSMYHSISWCIGMCHDMSWCIRMCHDTSWCIRMYLSILWYAMMYCDVSWCIMVYCDLSSLLGCSQSCGCHTCWHSLLTASVDCHC